MNLPRCGSVFCFYGHIPRSYPLSARHYNFMCFRVATLHHICECGIVSEVLSCTTWKACARRSLHASSTMSGRVLYVVWSRLIANWDTRWYWTYTHARTYTRTHT